MTDEVQGSASPNESSSSTPPASSAGQEPASERTFRQSEVTDIVKRERQEAVDRYQRLQREQPEYAAQKYGQQAAQGTQFSEERARQIASEEAQRLRDQWIADAREQHERSMVNQTIGQFNSKVYAAKEKYEDFDKVTGDLLGDDKAIAAFPNVVQLLAHHVENSGDVMYDLAKDTSKLLNLELMAKEAPQLAIRQIQRLAKSIADNEAASKVKLPNEPLSQLRPSLNGTGGGDWSVSAARRKYKG